MSDPATVAKLGTPLTPAERRAVEAYRDHGSVAAAAKALGVSVHTVRNALANARSRRGLRRSWELFTERSA